MIELSSGSANARIDPAAGGRVASFNVGGRDLIVDYRDGDGPMAWGSYPMVPWAGRVRHGRFRFDGEDFQLPITLDAHAIHGTGYLRAWDLVGPNEIRTEFGSDWPFGGHAVQRFTMAERSFTCELEVHAADRPMPAMLGWHPWFHKPDTLAFHATEMYPRDDEWMATAPTIVPPPPPWDDSFTGVDQPITLTWGATRLTISSTCDHWVVYTMPDHATCVEPQSGPADEFNMSAKVVEPGAPLIHSMTWSW